MARLRALLLLGFWFAMIAILGPLLIASFMIARKEAIIYGPVEFFVKLGLKIIGVKVIVEGLDRLDPNQTYIFTPNHQSLIEVPLLMAFLGRKVAYLAKEELFRYPILGSGMRLIGIVPVDRLSPRAAARSARIAVEKLRRGKSYVIYPEGTRSPDGRLREFKKGAFLMAIQSGTPIVPVSISGGAAVMPKGQLSIYPSTIRIVVHEPIMTRGRPRSDLPKLIEEVRAKVASALTPWERGAP
jgi:1-acyl-sn-glycerol-3-phosphate acyltransferase